MSRKKKSASDDQQGNVSNDTNAPPVPDHTAAAVGIADQPMANTENQQSPLPDDIDPALIDETRVVVLEIPFIDEPEGYAARRLGDLSSGHARELFKITKALEKGGYKLRSGKLVMENRDAIVCLIEHFSKAVEHCKNQ